MEFANIAAIVIGNLLGGQIYKSYGYLEVLSISPISFGCGLLYAIIFIKDTKPPISRDRFWEVVRDLFRLDNMKRSYNTCSKKRPGSIRLQIWLLMYISCLMRFTDMGKKLLNFDQLLLGLKPKNAGHRQRCQVSKTKRIIVNVW